MGQAQQKMYVPKSEEEFQCYSDQQQQGFNSNVIVIAFHILKDKSKIAMGDAVFCKQCIAALNKYSKVEAYKEQQQQEQYQNNNQSSKKLWVCEFCSYNNIISIEDEEIPKEDDLMYVLQSNVQANQQQQSESDINIIFCIDNSGSMAVTSEVKGDLMLKRGTVTKEEIENLKQFMEPQELQYYLNDLKNQQKFVSRKNCVLAAIEAQLEEQIKNYPKRKVGLVIFGDDVTIIGDGFQNPLTITGDKLFNYDQLFQEGVNSSESHLQNNVGQSYQKLIENFEKMQEKGKTALGPALLTSLGLASKGKAGSVIIMCTDGLANIGVGALDNDLEQNKSQEFYEKIGNFAQEKGIIIQTITMKGEQCNVMSLGTLAEKTNGSIVRVNPEKIQEDFANVMKDEVLATSVQIRVLLHAGLQFKSIPELDDKIIIEGQTCTRKIGIVTEKTSVSFEYDLKNVNQLKEENIDLKNFKELPFQAHIFYTSQEGHKMVRVITRIQPLSNDYKEVRKKANLKLLNKHVEMNSAQQAYKGNVIQAQQKNAQWDMFLGDQKQILEEEGVDYLNQEENKEQNESVQQLQQDLQQLESIQKINISNKTVLKKQQFVLENKSKKQQNKSHKDVEDEEDNAMDILKML